MAHREVVNFVRRISAKRTLGTADFYNLTAQVCAVKPQREETLSVFLRVFTDERMNIDDHYFLNCISFLRQYVNIPAVVRFLLTNLHHPDADVRVEAMKAVMLRFHAPDVRRTLFETARKWADEQCEKNADPTNVNQKADWKLISALLTAWEPYCREDAEVRRAAARFLTAAHPVICETAIRTLATCCDDDDIRAAILPLTESDNPRIRTAALKAVSPQIADPEVRRRLHEFVSNPNDTFGSETFYAAAPYVLGDPEFREIILSHLLAMHPFVQISAVRKMEEYAAMEGVQHFMLDIIKHEKGSIDLRNELLNFLMPYAKKPFVRDVLIDELHKQNFMSFLAVKALSPLAGDEPIQSELLKKFTGKEPPWDFRGAVRENIVAALAPYCQRPTVRAAFLTELETGGDDYVNKRIVEALAPFVHMEEVRSALLNQLRPKKHGIFPPGGVVRAVVQALASVAHMEEVLGALLNQLPTENNRVVPPLEGVKSVVEALAPHIRRPEVRTALFNQITSEQNRLRAFPQIRESIVKALAPCAEDPAVTTVLIEHFHDPWPKVREAAVKGAATQAGRSSVKNALLEKLEDEDPKVRRAAVRALSPYVNEETVMERLAAKLDDPNRYVRRAAMKAFIPGTSRRWIRRLDASEKINFGTLAAEEKITFLTAWRELERKTTPVWFITAVAAVRKKIKNNVAVFLPDDFNRCMTRWLGNREREFQPVAAVPPPPDMTSARRDHDRGLFGRLFIGI